MTLKEQMETDLKSVFFNADDFSDVCTYTPHSTGIAIADVSVMLDIGTSLSQTEYGAAEIDTASFIASEIPSPKMYDTFCCNDIQYTVRSRTKTVHGVHTVSIDTDQRQNPGN